MTTHYYAGIGSRETPQEILDLMREMASDLVNMNWILRSGGAGGADTAFEAGVPIWAGKQIFIPWEGFSERYHGKRGAICGWPNDDIAREAFNIAAKQHPNWAACKQGARLLHARNVGQVLGPDLQTPSDMVICWTVGGKGGGGTGQAIRIAKAYGVPVFDLGRDTDQVVERIQEFVWSKDETQ